MYRINLNRKRFYEKISLVNILLIIFDRFITAIRKKLLRFELLRRSHNSASWQQ